jgi:hypothetical protein
VSTRSTAGSGFAEELDPGALHARIVGRCFDEVQEVGDRVVEARPKAVVRYSAGAVEGVVGSGKGEHVGIDARAEVLERDPQ